LNRTSLAQASNRGIPIPFVARTTTAFGGLPYDLVGENIETPTAPQASAEADGAADADGTPFRAIALVRGTHVTLYPPPCQVAGSIPDSTDPALALAASVVNLGSMLTCFQHGCRSASAEA
jgi:hypothetical protein